MFAVQLAHAYGAHVITTVSASNIALVKSLGADEALDYRGTPFEDCVREIHLVFDTVGGDTLRRSWQVLKPGGRLVTVAVDSEGIDALVEAIDRHREFGRESGAFARKRRDRAAERVRDLVARTLERRVWLEGGGEERLEAALDDIIAGRLSPYAVAEEIARMERG